MEPSSPGGGGDRPFLLFSGRRHSPPPPPVAPSPPSSPVLTKHSAAAAADDDDESETSFADLGLSQSSTAACAALGMRRPTPVQRHCIPRILASEDVLGIAQTGTGKTAAFALPILDRLAAGPYGVFALIITPTRELAAQLVEQFRALSSGVGVRCTLVVGGMGMMEQARDLIQRPHIVVSTPGRIKVLMEEDPDIASVFSKTKFLVLDEADRVLDVGFEEELRAIFKCLPKTRQTLLFSTTMTSDLQSLLEISTNKSYFYEAYEGFKTVDSLRTCHLLSMLLRELEQHVAALHSHQSQSLQLSALNQFKSGIHGTMFIV